MSDNECNVDQTKDLGDFENRIVLTNLQQSCAGESAIAALRTRACKHCARPFVHPDLRRKHCSETCAYQSKCRHRNIRQAAYRAQHPDRERAKLTLGNAIRGGHIRRVSRCEECGERCFTEAHHTDYARPLYVTWLCRTCHAGLENGRHFGAGQTKHAETVAAGSRE